MILAQPMYSNELKARVHGLHLTVNGMGRTGRQCPACQPVAVLNDYEKNVRISVDEKSLYRLANW